MNREIWYSGVLKLGADRLKVMFMEKSLASRIKFRWKWEA